MNPHGRPDMSVPSPFGCEVVKSSEDGEHRVTLVDTARVHMDVERIEAACICGWRACARITFADTLATNDWWRKLESLHEQVMEHVRPSPPSLADLTDLGWFCPEVNA